MTSRNRSRETDGSTPESRDDLRDTHADACGAPGTAEAREPGQAGPEAARAYAPDHALVRIQDFAGRPRGTGFLADHRGTLVTSHEAVDGLPQLVLHAGDRRCVLAADAVTPLPAQGLALVRTEGLGVAPLPVTARDRIDVGTYVRIAAGGWREARVLGATDVTYTATDRRHPVADALELAIGTAGRDALRLGGGAAGGPVLDAGTGAVLGVLGTALRSSHRDVGFAVPLRPAEDGPLAGLLAENAATVPGYGADLNLAGILELTATSVAQDGPPDTPVGPGAVQPVEREATAREFAAFTAGPAAVLGLVGVPGSGRTTELAALAARRGRCAQPTLWLRGADLRDDDTSVADAVRRALARAARIVAASRAPRPTDLGDTSPERLARLSRTAGRPLLLLLDGPEEMPPLLAHRLADWTDSTARWLLATGARLVVACRAEYWEVAGAEFPPELLYRGRDFAAGPMAGGTEGGPGATRGSRFSGGAVCGGACPGGASPEGGCSGGASPGEGFRGGAGCGEGFRGGAASGGAVFGDRLSGGAAPGEGFCGGAAPKDRFPGGAAPGGGFSGGVVSEGGLHGGVMPADGFPGGVAPGEGSPGGVVSEGGLHGGAARGGATPGGAAPGGAAPSGLPACVRLGELGEGEALLARVRYGIPDGVLVGPDARHPLTLRLLAEVRAALLDAPSARVDRHDVLSAYLDLMCLRVAVRLAAENGLRGSAVRRLAAKVAGQVHEAARRSLGPGEGELDRAAFETVFPSGPAPARLGGGTGWASAVLTEGLLVPAGAGYRFAHEELADWIQGTHLDLDEALRALVHSRRTPHAPPVPHHRIGPVVQALLLLARQEGTDRLARRLDELALALDAAPDSWWAARLLTETLLRVPDLTPYTGLLRQLADRLVERRRQRRAVPDALGPGFWTALPLPEDLRFELLRRLVLADGPPGETGPRFLDAAARLLAADPIAVQRHLARWFDDERPLPATPHATVAEAAQALLHTHRHRALDELTEVLVETAHRRGDQLLAVLAEEEPAAVCRAVDRWAHDERPARRVAAVAYGLRAAPHVRTEADRERLRDAALALLARPADGTLHGGALALLVRDPRTRARHLTQALQRFADGDPQFPPSALVAALTTHPEPVLDAFRTRLTRPEAGDVLRTLADVTTPSLAWRVAALVREAVQQRPELAGHVAAYVDRRLDQGPVARAVLLPLVTGLLDGGPEPVRAALAGILAAPGAPASGPLRRELLDVLLAREREPAVLDALLHAAAPVSGDDLRALVHRTGLLLVRTPDGAARFDRGLVDLGRHVPGFAARVAGWLAEAPQDWAAVVGPSARRMIENLAGARVPV